MRMIKYEACNFIVFVKEKERHWYLYLYVMQKVDHLGSLLNNDSLGIKVAVHFIHGNINKNGYMLN